MRKTGHPKDVQRPTKNQSRTRSKQERSLPTHGKKPAGGSSIPSSGQLVHKLCLPGLTSDTSCSNFWEVVALCCWRFCVLFCFTRSRRCFTALRCLSPSTWEQQAQFRDSHVCRTAVRCFRRSLGRNFFDWRNVQSSLPVEIKLYLVRCLNGGVLSYQGFCFVLMLRFSSLLQASLYLQQGLRWISVWPRGCTYVDNTVGVGSSAGRKFSGTGHDIIQKLQQAAPVLSNCSPKLQT